MSKDYDYGCNADNPESIIAVILDDGQTAKEIIEQLDLLGFKIVKKDHD